MNYTLDNPAWNALNSGNKHLANGNEIAKYFSPEVSPFAGVIENNNENFEILYESIPFDSPVGILSIGELTATGPWNVIERVTGFQMVYKGSGLQPLENNTITLLNQENVPEMLELTGLTKPGPFSVHTIHFGNYEGIFEGGKLVAMAGHRLHCYEYIEISAVCTRPGYTGKGYARQLIQSQIRSIQAKNCVPYLHVKDDNPRAIKIYRDLGFEWRTNISIYILQKKL